MEGSVGWGMIRETLFSSYWLSLLASVKCLLTALAPLLSFIEKRGAFRVLARGQTHLLMQAI